MEVEPHRERSKTDSHGRRGKHKLLTVSDIDIRHRFGSVWMNDSKQPALTVEPPLVNTNGKKIGFWAGNTSGGDWKNLKINR
jgi:hypothetical protein